MLGMLAFWTATLLVTTDRPSKVRLGALFALPHTLSAPFVTVIATEGEFAHESWVSFAVGASLVVVGAIGAVAASVTSADARKTRRLSVAVIASRLPPQR